MNRSDGERRGREVPAARVRIATRLRPNQAGELRKLAQQRDLSQATLVRHAVARFLEEEAAR